MPSFRARRLLLVVAAALLLPASTCVAQTPDQQPPKQTWLQRFLGIKPDLSGGWLCVGFKGNSHDGLYFAVSKDGYLWQSVNFDRPILWQEQRGELMRDPFLQRAPDGSVRMVWTWSSDSPAAIGYSTSTDLIHWSKQLRLPVAEVLPDATHVSAPATYYQPDNKDWLILFSATAPSEPGDRIYATTTADFKTFQPAKVFSGHNLSDPTSKITVPDGLSHGSLLHLQTSEYNLLHYYHGASDSALDK
jgi:hypothetical protein